LKLYSTPTLCESWLLGTSFEVLFHFIPFEKKYKQLMKLPEKLYQTSLINYFYNASTLRDSYIFKKNHKINNIVRQNSNDYSNTFSNF